MSECNWNNTWRDSGDRGAAQHDHDRHFHPDHNHVWGFSYDWEKKGEPHIAPGDRTKITPRPESANRCHVCKIRFDDNMEGRCQ